VKTYKELKVWAKGMTLAAEVYALSRLLPKAEQYGMTSQLLRAAASVPAHIAEGYQRGTRRDYANFISIARGSLAETETFLLLATNVGLLSEADSRHALALADELGRMLTTLRVRLINPRP
jgi:four helix bundle protein